MLKPITIYLLVLASLAYTANCPAKSVKNDAIETGKSMTENGTQIKLIVGETVILAVLNDSTPARALIAKLPYTMKLHRYEHDYCGVMSEPLPYDRTELRSGWKNGDIAFAVNGNYFAILYKDEEISGQFDGMVTMGTLKGDPSIMETLDRNIAVRIEAE